MDKPKLSLEQELSTRALTLDMNSYDKEKGTVDVVFATENPVLTRDCDYQVINEVLSCEPSSVRMERISNGAPVLDQHDRHGSVTRAVLGRVISARIYNGECRATLKISKRDELKGFRQDLEDGVVGNISAGYVVYKYLDISERDANIRTLKAVDWEPYEITFTSVQADYKSQVRSADIANNKPEIKMANTAEDTPETPVASTSPAATPAATPAAAALAAVAEPVAEGQRAAQTPAAPGAPQDLTTQERTRIMSIDGLLRTAAIEDEEFRTRMINDGLPLDQVRAAIFETMEKTQSAAAPATNGNSNIRLTGGDSETMIKTRGITEALSLRILGEAPVTEEGKKRANNSFVDHARSFLHMGGMNTDGLSGPEIIQRSLATTDYPLALADVMNKTLKKPFSTAESSWRKFATKVPANDFKNLYGVRVDGSFLPEEITEDGEYKAAAFKETGDSFALKTWGKTISFTRKMMINDDLSAFTRVAPAFANGMLRKEAEIVYGLLTMNSGVGRTLADSIALFNAATHKNYVSSGTVMSLTAYNLAKVAMRRQTGLDGQPINVTPKYLLVPPELETLALQLVNSTINPTNTSQANPFYGVFEVIVDPFLTDPLAWYVISSPADIDVFLYATLSGQEGIWSDSRYNWDTDALETKVRYDFNATIQEYRGIYKNAGA